MIKLPTVSVVVPCYNYARYLRECVESVLGQAGVDVQVLIIDDASTDDSARLAAQLAAADARVGVRVHPSNHGHISTYNEGLEWATGAYTVLLDADDVLTAGSLQRACELLEAHPGVGLVYGAAPVFRDGDRRPPARNGPPRWTIWPGREWFELRCRATENCIRSPEAVVRSSLLRRVGGFRQELPHTADLELWMRLALYADVGHIGGPPQAYYRDHPASMHRQRFGTELADLQQIGAAFTLLFRDHRESIADCDRLDDVVRRTLARRALQAACRVYDRGERDPAEAVGLEQLAVTTYGAVEHFEEMQELRRRQRLGPRLWRIARRLRSIAKRIRGRMSPRLRA